MPGKGEVIFENGDSNSQEKNLKPNRLNSCCFGFFPTAVSFTGGVFGGLGIESVVGSLNVNFLSLTGALPALIVSIPTILISIGLYKSFNNNKAALISSQLLLGVSAVILSKSISAAFIALSNNAPLDPLILPYMISASVVMIALLLLACVINCKNLSCLLKSGKVDSMHEIVMVEPVLPSPNPFNNISSSNSGSGVVTDPFNNFSDRKLSPLKKDSAASSKRAILNNSSGVVGPSIYSTSSRHSRNPFDDVCGPCDSSVRLSPSSSTNPFD